MRSGSPDVAANRGAGLLWRVVGIRIVGCQWERCWGEDTRTFVHGNMDGGVVLVEEDTT